MSKKHRRELTCAEKMAVASNWMWLAVSLAVALLVWFALSRGEATARSFPFIHAVIDGMKTMIDREALWSDFASSMI